MICRACGGTGRTKDSPNECPSCGKRRIILNKGISIPVEEKPHIDYEDIVPSAYKGKLFNGEVLKKMYPGNTTFERYCKNLQRLLEQVTIGELPKASAIFYAPTGHAKHLWAYSMIKQALQSGLSVLPLLDFSDLNNIYNNLNMSETAVKYLRNIREYDIYTADLCIIYINNHTIKHSRLMLNLLDKRSNYNKNTFFISTESRGSIISYASDINNLFTPDNVNGRHLFYVPYK